MYLEFRSTPNFKATTTGTWHWQFWILKSRWTSQLTRGWFFSFVWLIDVKYPQWEYIRITPTTIMDKSLGTLLHFWGVLQFTQVQPLPSPHKQCWMRVFRIFFEFQLCIGWEEEELRKNFPKRCIVLKGNREMTEKYEYCSTVPKTFVQDCRYTVDSGTT